MTFIFRIIGACLLLSGATLALWVCYNVFIEMNPHFQGRSVGGATAFAVILILVGWGWLRGKSFLGHGSFDPQEEDSERTGNESLIKDWPWACRSIIRQLRPLLRATGGEFLRIKPGHHVVVGWPGGLTRLCLRYLEPSRKLRNIAVLLRPGKPGTLHLILRVGKESGLISPQGPLHIPKQTGLDSPDELGVIALDTSSEVFLPKITEWIALAASFTRDKYGIASPSSLDKHSGAASNSEKA